MCWDCDYNTKGDPYKNYRRGGVEVEDFEMEVDYGKRLSGQGKKKRDKVKTRPGCPENNYKAHVYVWTTEFNEEDIFFKHYGYHRKEQKVCAGCLKGTDGYSERRLTERYAKVKAKKYAKIYGDGTSVPRGEPRSRYSYRDRLPSYSYWRWEAYDPEFVDAVNAYNKRHSIWSERYYISGLW